MDGTTSLKWPIFTISFAIVYDPDIYNLDAITFAELTSFEILLVGMVKETCLSVTELCGLLGMQLLTVMTPITYGMFFLSSHLS